MEPVLPPLNENDWKHENMAPLIVLHRKRPILMYRMYSCHTMEGRAHAVKQGCPSTSTGIDRSIAAVVLVDCNV